MLTIFIASVVGLFLLCWFAAQLSLEKKVTAPTGVVTYSLKKSSFLGHYYDLLCTYILPVRGSRRWQDLDTCALRKRLFWGTVLALVGLAGALVVACVSLAFVSAFLFSLYYWFVHGFVDPVKVDGVACFLLFGGYAVLFVAALATAIFVIIGVMFGLIKVYSAIVDKDTGKENALVLAFRSWKQGWCKKIEVEE